MSEQTPGPQPGDTDPAAAETAAESPAPDEAAGADETAAPQPPDEGDSDASEKDGADADEAAPTADAVKQVCSDRASALWDSPENVSRFRRQVCRNIKGFVADVDQWEKGRDLTEEQRLDVWSAVAQHIDEAEACMAKGEHWSRPAAPVE